MQSGAWQSRDPILAALCGILLALSSTVPAQSVDQRPGAARLQLIPHTQRLYQSQSTGRAQSPSPTPQITQLCKPSVTGDKIVATAEQRKRAGDIALPPLTDEANGFAWPDTELGVIKTASGYTFFGSDGGYHARQYWEDEKEGNNKYGSVTRTLGSLDNPLGSESPIDVTIKPNPDPAVRFIGYPKASPVPASYSWSTTLRSPRSRPKVLTPYWPSPPHPMKA